MIVGVYALKDRLSGFADVKLVDNDAAAMRNFRFMVSESNSFTHFSKDDYSLVKLGEFDTITGELIVKEKEIIIRGSDIIE